MTTTQFPKQVITLDMDGTLEDPWACCAKSDRKGGSAACRHIRFDTIAKVGHLRQAFPEAELVVLSWRSGLIEPTLQWLKDVGITVAAVFIPGSADAAALGAQDAGQIGFKVNVVKALQAAGTEVVTGFDDNFQVVEALRAEGVPAIHAPHQVKIQPWEKAAGYIGAPRPAQRTFAPLADDWYNDDCTPRVLDDLVVPELGKRWAQVGA